MGGLLDELGRKLADRWLTLLVLPGALYLGAVVIAATLGHTHALSANRLIGRLDQWTATAHAKSATGLTIILLVAFLLSAAACGLAAQALGALTERLWLAADWATWPPPLRQAAAALTRRRHAGWTQAVNAYQQAKEEAAAALASARLSGQPAPPAGLATAHHRIMRISAEPPARPTWMGDRLNALATRLDRDLDLDLATVWPYLWLTAPETTRSEITAARETLDRAATLAGWGLLYIVVGALWWPGLPAAAIIIATAGHRARTATDTYALLIEATVRLYATALANDLGLQPDRTLTRETGRALTSLLQPRSPSTLTRPAGRPQ
jgi:hypothetical protein